MPYGNKDLHQHWFRQSLVTWSHIAISCTNVDLPYARSSEYLVCIFPTKKFMFRKSPPAVVAAAPLLTLLMTKMNLNTAGMIYLIHATLYPMTIWVEVGHTGSYHPQTTTIQGFFHYFHKLQIKILHGCNSNAIHKITMNFAHATIALLLWHMQNSKWFGLHATFKY